MWLIIVVQTLLTENGGIVSLEQKCMLQCDLCGENVKEIIKIQEHKWIHHMKDSETQYNSLITTPIHSYTAPNVSNVIKLSKQKHF